jgi:hypothetical protein
MDFAYAVLVIMLSLTTSSATSRREVGTISFAITTDTTASCDIGLTNAGIYAVLEYRFLPPEPTSSWQRVGVISIPPPNSSQCQHEISHNFSYAEQDPDRVQFRVVQWEHGGGYCNCWGIVPNTTSIRTTVYNISLSQE